MKKILLVSLVLACLPALTMAQDDLYFVPKKKAEKKVTTSVSAKVVDDKEVTSVQTVPGTTVIVKDVKGEVRDVDEYNRRYTSRDNTFSMENDTLYIEEKPYNERGEWVNGFDGTQDDYEYAMRIVRFRNPRFAIPVSSPLYWDVVYTLPSWEWNVFDDGMYAYVFPTYTNRLWWDWRYSYPWGSSWSLSWGWHSPWWNSWYGPGYWGGGYWAGYWGHHHHHRYHHGPMYAGVGGYWGTRHGRFGSSALNPGIHTGRYSSNVNRGDVAKANNRRQVSSSSARTGRDTNMDARRARRSDSGVSRGESNQSSVRKSTAGRVVRSNRDNANSVRPRTTNRTNEGTNVRDASNARRSNSNTYVRSTESKGSSYNRPSSTRSSVTNRSASYQRKSEGSSYRNSSTTTRNTQNNSSYRSNSSSNRSSSSSFSNGGSSSRSSAGGGTRSSGGGSRGGRR